MIALADAFEEHGHYESAAQILYSALRLKESELGVDHPDLADDLYNLGLLCWVIDEPAEAQRFLLRAYDIYKRRLRQTDQHLQEVASSLVHLQEEFNVAIA